MRNQLPRQRRGFTLVELLIVMSIILVLVAVALPAANSARQKAKNVEVKAGVNQIQQALERYAVDNGGNYPGAHWIADSTGNLHVGPGVIGATPSFGTAGRPNQDFGVPKSGNNAVLGDNSTPNPNYIDALVANGYLTDYPANPFIKSSDAGRAQMSNLFLFNPILGDTTPDPARPDTLDFNRYTRIPQTGTMRQEFTDLARGHFSYIPLNPVNLTGIDYATQWNALPANQLQDFYKRCRGYMLIGWGHARTIDDQSKGLSAKFWNSSDTGFDFDQSMNIDPLERVLSDVTGSGILEREMRDSDGSVGDFGVVQVGTNGAPNIDAAFKGATIIVIPGS